MNWGSFSEFLAMGGYALYVWGSYAAALVLITVEIVVLGGRQRRALDDARRTPRSAGEASQ